MSDENPQRLNGHRRRGESQHRTETTISPMPIIVTKFEHKGEQYGCGDYAEGFFTRDRHRGFVFKVYFDDEPNEDTYKGTRMSDISIEAHGTLQWNWHSLKREEPGWEFGELLLADLLAGVESAMNAQLSDNVEYCISRVHCLVDQLIHAGIDRAHIQTALRQGLRQAQGENEGERAL